MKLKLLLLVLCLGSLAAATAAYAACDGGDCSDTAGTSYSCPTSGGPSCANNQSCSCVCKSIVGTNGVTYIVATNTCAQKGNPVAFEPLLDPNDELEIDFDAEAAE